MSAPPDEPPFPGYRSHDPEYRRITLALFFAGVATFATLYSTQALLPELATAFDVAPGEATLSLSVTTVGLGLALLLAGPLSEAYGRTRLIHFSLVAAPLVGIACAFAPTWEALLGLRLLQGVALAGLPAVATAYLREELHATVTARAAGLYIGGTALGGMTGRLVTAAFGEAAGWQWALGVIALVGLGCALAVRLLLPRSRNFAPVQARFRRLAVLLAGALKDPALLALYVVGGCGMGAFVAAYNSLSFRLVAEPFGLGLGTVGLVFLVYPVGTVGSIAAGRIAGRLSRRRVLPVASLVVAVGLVLTVPDHLGAVIGGLAIMTGGFFAVHGVASGWVPVRAHAAGVAPGPAASLYLFAYYLGSSVFGTVAGLVWTAGQWPGVLVLTLALTGIVLTMALLLARRRSSEAGER
ncbi:MAG TPA: MFS transporter [Candidatus Ruania gallistercoris]|uniref:MFS transporter n=1 Tax=Candidatus Ruania gallistercoris TaxID=2838746 RepID=A0A9D2J5D6_9MICO|nr:MFS transporter [Candidatus Ruania gallistercoris]